MTSSNFTPEAYRAAVLRAKEYIAAGDVFQVVPSQRFTAPFGLPPFSLYRYLILIFPSCCHSANNASVPSVEPSSTTSHSKS